MAETMKGFSDGEALWHLLRLKGETRSLPAFRESLASVESPHALAVALEKEGFQARATLLQADELPFLDLPTLLQLQDGSWVLVQRPQGRTAWACCEKSKPPRIPGKRVMLTGSNGSQSVTWEAMTGLLSGYALDLSPGMPEQGSAWRRLCAMILPQKKTLATILLATLMLQGLSLLMPELTAQVMNRALPNGAHSTLTLAAIGMLSVALFQAWTGFIREHALLFLLTRLEVSVERGFLEHLLRLPFPFLHSKTLGDMLQAFGALMNCRDALSEKILGAILDGALAFCYLAVMAFKLGAPTVFVTGIALLMAAITYAVGRAQVKQETLEVEAHAKEQGLLTELIAGIGTIKAAGAETQSLHHWLDKFQRKLGYTLAKSRIGLWTEVGLTTLQQVSNVTLIVWGGKLALDGQLDLGTLFAYLQLSYGFMGAVSGLSSAYLMLVVMKPQLTKVREILETPVEEAPRLERKPFSPLEGPVVMENVWFRYSPNSPWILKGYSLHIEAGTKFLLRGPSGMGKSTVLRLLSGLYIPEQGHITIAGQSPLAARQKIFYLPQFVQIYGGTILENLRALSGVNDMDKLMAASIHTGLHHLVESFPMGFETILPHGGQNLSGGQRQLIALTAAFAANRPLMLLDESTSMVDNMSALGLTRMIHESPWTMVGTSHQ